MNISVLANKLGENISKVLKGKDREIALVLCALFAGGHVLLEDVPGTGKTTLANALARSVSVSCRRIQFTPDLLPADITGVDFFNMKTQEFTFHPGPVFSNIVIADEINRATPRTQSALLECMQERQVTVGNNTYKLGMPFFVIATENPIEIKGTFPLPEAQTDRFIMKLSLGYPHRDAELDVLRSHITRDPLASVGEVCTAQDIINAQRDVEKITVSDAVAGYIVDLVNATRNDPKIRLGVSPRGGIALMQLSRAYAAMKGRDYVLPDDVRELVLPCFGHRILSNTQRSLATSDSNETILSYIVETVKAPIE